MFTIHMRIDYILDVQYRDILIQTLFVRDECDFINNVILSDMK